MKDLGYNVLINIKYTQKLAINLFLVWKYFNKSLFLIEKLITYLKCIV